MDTVDQEVDAIKNVLAALSPLSPKARASVLDYVIKRLDITPSNVPPTGLVPPGQIPPKEETKGGTAGSGAVHIKDFKHTKKPRSANEMAALVAYYLSSVAPKAERKDTVNQNDIETYFKIAGYPLPKQIRVTLQNARTAGYFDSVGSGEYKLNAVGHNLVVHSMPRGAASEGTQPSRKKKISSKK
jgi:hypothetical protein